MREMMRICHTLTGSAGSRPRCHIWPRRPGPKWRSLTQWRREREREEERRRREGHGRGEGRGGGGQGGGGAWRGAQSARRAPGGDLWDGDPAKGEADEESEREQ